MHVAHRYHSDRIGWTSATNLFSLMFALLAALALIVLLMLFLATAAERKANAGNARPSPWRCNLVDNPHLRLTLGSGLIDFPAHKDYGQ